MMPLIINPAATALIIIDLQKGIVDHYPTVPYPAADIVRRSVQLAEALRARGGFVAAVNVDFVDGRDVLQPLTDNPPQTGARPADWARLVPEIDAVKSVGITKRQWGAFHGTELDLQLRRRDIDTIVMCGISTSIGVDTTAREAFQHGYRQIFAEDAMGAQTEDEHRYTVSTIFPRIGRVRSTEDLLHALQS
ncbi:isochorismatase family protein [Paenibacillus humicola]|uniref:isochorismatase family protein n=1 Tax=Paenibacillus humicola TaxID=3110540 RepID=UPI00237A9459|nr:isochorismatase family protein [Paenibacillus humicola]